MGRVGCPASAILQNGTLGIAELLSILAPQLFWNSLNPARISASFGAVLTTILGLTFLLTDTDLKEV